MGAEDSRAHEADPRPRRQVERPRRPADCSSTSRSTATPRRGSACASTTSTARSTTHSRSGRSRPSTPSATSTASSSRSTRGCSATRPTSSISTCRAASGAQVPLMSVIRVDEKHGSPLVVNHQGPFPAVTITYDLAPGNTLDAGAARHRSGRWRRCMLRRDCAARWRATRGLRPAVLAAAAAHPRRADRRLHRAGRALREPRAPADHHLDAAVGRARRAVGAVASPAWSCR